MSCYPNSVCDLISYMSHLPKLAFELCQSQLDCLNCFPPPIDFHFQQSPSTRDFHTFDETHDFFFLGIYEWDERWAAAKSRETREQEVWDGEEGVELVTCEKGGKLKSYRSSVKNRKMKTDLLCFQFLISFESLTSSFGVRI